MNRLVSYRVVSRVSIACMIAVLALPVPAAFARKVKNQHAKTVKGNPLGNLDSKQPDKELFDKAMTAMRKGKYDLCRLDLQTLLNTYPDSEYQMRAKLAVGDSWFKEGGSAAYTQAESEYKDFITFFPNVPEAAEAQMKVADIYYMQMNKPDRDYTNVQHAEQEYRNMIQQFPDSSLVPRAKQRLREVQEVLAQREFEIGQFYATHENWAATIARLQTVTDSYPLFSHSDQALISLGDAYSAQARAAQNLRLPPDAKAKLVRIYENRAAAAYRKVVRRYPMAPHVEDAKDRLIALNRSIPEPTAEALAENEAEEQSRATVHLKDRALLMVKHGPSTIEAARVGEPTLVTPAMTTAPQVSDRAIATFNSVMGVKPAVTAATASAAAGGEAAPRSDQPAAAGPPQLENVPETGGNSVGVEIVSPGSAPASPSAAPDANATPSASPAPDANGGLKAVGPENATPLPAVDKPDTAPDQHNDVTGSAPAQVTTGAAAADKKNKPKYESDSESSSKHKKKKGLSKVNPF